MSKPKRKKGYNYLLYPGLKPDEMNNVQWNAWDDYIDYLACQVPSSSLADKINVDYLRMAQSKKLFYKYNK